MASGQSLASDTLFRIFSMTNPVTGVAMMILFDQGLWRSEDPIAQHLPEFADVKVFVDVDRAGQPRLEFRLGKGPISETVTPALGSGSVRSMTCCSSV